MSAIKKVVKGIVNFTKKVEKAGHRFVKKYWKQILIAAAIVFTAGIATVGVAGFSSAMAAGGGGFAGFMSAAGSTMVAGTAAIGGSVGIGSGVTASTAGGAFAAAPVMSGVAAGSGLTLGTGAAAQGLGLAASTYAPAATAASAGATSIGTSGLTAGATGATSGGYGAGGYLTAANPAPGLMGTAGSTGGATAAGAAGTAATTGITSNAASVATQEAAKKGVLSTVLNSRLSGPLLSAGVQGISGYMQGKQQQQMMEDTRPLSFWGAGARGQGGGAVNSPFSSGDSLTHFDGQSNGQQNIGAYVRDPRAGLPNGNQWMNNLPNGNQGLMALGWDVNTGQPYDPNEDPNNPTRYN